MSKVNQGKRRALFHQSDFSGGLNAKIDAAKVPENAYPLLINGRTRRNVITPTNKHELLENAPEGNYQGLYITGSFILLFVSGVAYWANAENDPVLFYPVGNWTTMDANVKRIYAELVPATSNLFNRTGTPDTVTKTFNKALAVFQQAIFCFDGSASQAVFADGTATSLGSYATWTKDNPLYVPAGILPAFASNKLFVGSPDGSKILHSVSGRASDFVINLTPAGEKGGDADTISQTVSFNRITAIRSISSGQVLVGTLYGTYVLELDNAEKIFGEPYLRPIFLFPAGPLNELSIVDVLSDTAMITQSGIHAFNAVAQAKRESNNFPLGSQIRGLITDPVTEKALIQRDTCTGIYDDYALFAVNTIYGTGVLVYDTTTQNFQSLDLSFGHVKQFASTRIDGVERLFYITHDNHVYEAFAGSEKNTTRILLGEWTPDEAPDMILSYMVDAVFANVRESGEVKFSIFADHKLVAEVTQEVQKDDTVINLPMTIPFVDNLDVIGSGFHYDHERAWRLSCMVEWNFAGELTDFSVDGKIESGDNVRLELPVTAESENFAFVGNTGYTDELRPVGGTFSADGVTRITVEEGLRYVFYSANGEKLLNDSDLIEFGIFKAATDSVYIKGVAGAAMTFSLRTAENYLSVLDAIEKEENLTGILHGGGFAFPDGSLADVLMGLEPINIPIFPALGTPEGSLESGKNYVNYLGIPRFYTKQTEFLDLFFFNGESWEPDGIDETSMQTALVKNWLQQSTKPFKILIVYKAPRTNELSADYPGDLNLRHLANLSGLSAILSASSNLMEKIIVDNFPFFVCGTGGQTPSAAYDTDDFVSTTLGYLHIKADPLSCVLSFKDTTGKVLDKYALYS